MEKRVVSFRLTAEQELFLAKWALKLGVSESEIVRQAILQYEPKKELPTIEA